MMKTTRKLQIFVSSTFIDLKEERQAAVQAILKNGHIPAGMELFKAGDKSQWEIIKNWIEESDIYMLIIAGRYGSIEPDSGKSYTQLEYEYAVALNKPLFAIVVNDEWTNKKAKKEGVKIEDFKEVNNLSKLQGFKEVVMKKMVSFAEDLKDIKLGVGDSLNEISQREDLTGWVRADNTDFGKISEEWARLSKENSDLKSQLAELNKVEKINGVEIGVFARLLKNQKIKNARFDYYDVSNEQIIIENNLLLFYHLGKHIQSIGCIDYSDGLNALRLYQLIENKGLNFTEFGSKLLIYLEMNPYLLED